MALGFRLGCPANDVAVFPPSHAVGHCGWHSYRRHPRANYCHTYQGATPSAVLGAHLDCKFYPNDSTCRATTRSVLWLRTDGTYDYCTAGIWSPLLNLHVRGVPGWH